MKKLTLAFAFVAGALTLSTTAADAWVRRPAAPGRTVVAPGVHRPAAPGRVTGPVVRRPLRRW